MFTHRSLMKVVRWIYYFISFSEKCCIKLNCVAYDNEMQWTMDIYQFSIIIVLSCFSPRGRFSEDGHQYKHATEGDDVHLLCNTTDFAPVFWKFQHNSQDLPNYISLGGPVVPKYQSRFQMDNHSYTLTIYNVTVSDSGLYSCMESWGFGQTHATWLTVAERNDTLFLAKVTPATQRSDSLKVVLVVIPIVVMLIVMVVIIIIIIIIYKVHQRRNFYKEREAFIPMWNADYSHHHRHHHHHNPLCGVRYQKRRLDLFQLPMDVLEMLLMKAFEMTVVGHLTSDGHASETECLTYITLSSVCVDWWQTLKRWSQSDTNHRLQRLIKCHMTLFSIKHIIKELNEIIEPDYELLDQLISLQVITDRECSDIRSKCTVHNRADRLMDIIVTKPEQQCCDFLVALTRSDQKHVVNYIEHPEDTSAHFGDVRPLDKSHLLHINVNLPQLIELIDCNVELLERLVHRRSITAQQKSDIHATQDAIKRNRKLMEILKRRSVMHLKTFVECLRASKQAHLAPFILEKGVLATFDAKLDDNSVDEVIETENQIVRSFKSVLTECDAQTKQQLLTVLKKSLGEDIDLVALRKQNSIGCYFFCRSQQAVEHLCSERDNYSLHRLLESVFTILVWNAQQVHIKNLLCNGEDYQAYSHYFTKMSGFSKILHDHISAFQLPLEVFEMLLMKMFIMIFAGHLRTDGHVSEAEHLAYITLSGVCADWWQTLNGWPQSNTKHWVKHRLQRLVTCGCCPYRRNPLLANSLDTENGVSGVAHLDDKIFIVCNWSDRIKVFELNCERLEDIKVEGLKEPQDIVACSETRSLYVADNWGQPGCVWLISTDGQIIKSILTTDRLLSLSMTSRRLLCTCDDKLLLRGPDYIEIKRLSFTDMSGLRHAVETSRGTFVFCHYRPQPQVVEVDNDGRIISVFNNQQKLDWPSYLWFGSTGKIFVADINKHHILLLTSDLQLGRVLLDSKSSQLVKDPHRLFYVQKTRRLIVGGWSRGVVQSFEIA